MPDTTAVLRCAVHPARVARDRCPNCARPRCADDVLAHGEDHCGACAVEPVEGGSRTFPERVIASGLTVIPVTVVGGWIYSQYVEVSTFSWLVPALIGVAGASASTTVWQRGGGWSRPAVVIGLIAAVCGTAFGFRLFPHGPHDPLHPWHVVGLPYLCAVAGSLLWPIALGPPRKPKPADGPNPGR
ncbi:MAG TPA: hypothetical protein VHA79_11655 [Mycobacteriales bacterium]|nr:hypothetical protein [Mycobacteriales bacterium]HVX70332.1 hypothetical protein [Mycobacteriales bacterium]